MSETLNLTENLNQSTEWDTLASPNVSEATSAPEVADDTETPTEKIDLNNIDFEKITRAEIPQLEKQLGEILVIGTKEINKYQLIIENIKKQQAIASSIMRELAALKQLQEEADAFPFVLSKSEAPIASVAEPETPSEPEPELEPAPEPEEATEPTPAEPEVKEPEPAPKTAIELYEEMLQKRVNSGDLKPEEASTLFERVQAKINASNEPETQEAPETPETSAEPEETIDENTDWADWSGMSDEDWARYSAWSKSHDAENMQNLEARDPELARSIKESLAEREKKEAETTAPVETTPTTAPTEAEPTPEVDSEEPQWDKSAKDFSSTEELEAELEKMRKIIAENSSHDSNLFFAGDDESIANITPSVESVQLKIPEGVKEKLIEQKAEKLKEVIRQNYAIIGGQEGIRLLNTQFEDQNVESATYDRWWDSLTDEGRKVIAEIVKIARDDEIPQYASNSPVNGGFLAWYYSRMKNNPF